MIKFCKECNSQYTGSKTKHLNSHGMSIEEYLLKHEGDEGKPPICAHPSCNNRVELSSRPLSRGWKQYCGTSRTSSCKGSGIQINANKNPEYKARRKESTGHNIRTIDSRIACIRTQLLNYDEKVNTKKRFLYLVEFKDCYKIGTVMTDEELELSHLSIQFYHYEDRISYELWEGDPEEIILLEARIKTAFKDHRVTSRSETESFDKGKYQLIKELINLDKCPCLL